MPAKAELLVTPARLAELLSASAAVAVDCRFELSDKNSGRKAWLAGHIPGAAYAHLDNDLAAPETIASGRHPLPQASDFAAFLGRIGWDRSKLLVAYDERNNAMAARLWWLMRNFGLDAALLDGGLEAWSRAGLPLETGIVNEAAEGPPVLQPQADMTVSARTILDDLGQRSLTLLDARSPERYCGEVEPIDSKAGHIPGALNRPFALNLDESGCFKTADQLRGEFSALLRGRPPGSVVHSCGSGVTACHNRFAMELAGLDPGMVYAGSWSEWVRDETRPIATGSSPG